MGRAYDIVKSFLRLSIYVELKAHIYPCVSSLSEEALLYVPGLRKICSYPVRSNAPGLSVRLKAVSGIAEVIKPKPLGLLSHL